MQRLIVFLIIFIAPAVQAQQTPDQVYKKLFYDVQVSGIFEDSKTFVDCIPKRPAKKILKDYLASGIDNGDSIRLKNFVLANFFLPEPPPQSFQTTSGDIRTHIRQLWKILEREKDKKIKGSSLLPLPHSYIVPGGRFREIYYWDSYFTMLGLKESGEMQLAENMVKNFSYLLKNFGLIPNGNRTYYLTRSQPPYFSLMANLVSEMKGKKLEKDLNKALGRELKYWKENNLTRLENGMDAFYYSDQLSIPRQESYIEDRRTIEKAFIKARQINAYINEDSFASKTYQHIRSAAASGWDFSTRWFRNGKDLETIRTADIIPVDLNCLLFHLEETVNKSSKDYNDFSYENARKNRSIEIKKIFFNDSLGWYCDYDRVNGGVMNNPTLAGMYPLFLGLADKKEVPRIVDFLEKNFLKGGGVVTSMARSGEQWDAPNGWAPLQWITIIGLENYGYHELAKVIAERWIGLNKKVFERTGKLMEKYNVVDLDLEAGGGEYPSQDGFGWTNGVLLALMNKYNLR